MNKRLTCFQEKYTTDYSTQYTLRLFIVACWSFLKSKKCGWFRVFGIGLTWKHIDNGLTFSERNGYKKYLRIGNWIVKYLPYK